MIILIFWLCNENFFVYISKRFIVYQKLDLLSKKIKVSKGYNWVCRVYYFSLKFWPCVRLSNANKKCLENRILFKSVYLKKTKQKQKKNKKIIHTQVFRHYYIQQMSKISGKNSKDNFSWSSRNFSSFKEKIWIFENVKLRK